MRGTLFIVAAPSGAGKSSIVNACLSRDPEIALSVSFTSRLARPGERHAEHYHFVGKDVFQQMIEAGEQINIEALKYLNRLSDHLFVAARRANSNGADDIKWVPGGTR